MCRHSDTFHLLAGKVLAAKQGGFTIIVCNGTPPPMSPQQIVLAVLHNVANKAYLENNLSEDELEELHALINEGVHNV